MFRQPHSPLVYNYHSHKPLTTLLWMLDRPWWYYIIVVLAFITKHLPAFLMPIATSYAINSLKDGRYIFVEPWFIITAIVVMIQHVPAHVLFITLLSRTVRRLEKRLRAAIARRLQQLSIAFHDRSQTGRLQAKMLRDVDVVSSMSNTLLHYALFTVFTLLFSVTITMIKQPIMVIFFVVVIPIAILLRRLFKDQMKHRHHEFRSGVEAMSAKVSEMVEMIPVTRAHGVEQTEIDHMDKHLDWLSSRGRKLDRIVAFFGGSVWITMMFVRLGCLAFTGYLYHKGRIKIGDIVLYNSFFQMILGAAEGLLALLPTLSQGSESIKSIGEVLECPDIEKNEGKQPVSDVKGALTFDDITFAYPDASEAAVRHFSLNIDAGECVAFVGESGSGKTTLMHLAIGFVRPGQGRILLDGKDMDSLDLRTYRNSIAVVPQRVLLFAGTIRANIQYGMNSVSDDRLREVIEAANVAEFVDRLPDGLDTVIGERGAQLSGGQQQRISVARALVRDPRIIILDEATSALDVVSEALVQEAIERLVSDRTTLIVAHRLSTVRKADRIVVMKSSRCIELGTPQELLDRQGEFHKLHRMQQMLM